MKKKINLLTPFYALLFFANMLSAQVQVNVPATAGWVATGVFKGEGVDIIICATGSATLWPTVPGQCWRWATPSGLGGTNVCNNCACAACPRIALIGRFGTGPAFFVGDIAYIDHADPGTGQLFLMVNDDLNQLNDNAGGFNAIIGTSCNDIKLTKCISNHLSSGLSPTPIMDNGEIYNGANIDILSDFKIFPNPAYQEINVHFEIDAESDVTVSILDGMGRLLETIANDKFTTGSHTLKYTPPSGHSPIMFIQARINGQTRVEKVVLTN